MKPIKRAWWILIPAAAVIIIALLSAQTLSQYYVRSRLDPGVELQKALDNMAGQSSYRFSLHSGFTVDERREVISQVEGEKEMGNTHIKGEMVNTPVDLYYLDQTIYNYDSFSKKWLVIDSGTSSSEDLLMSELNPLSNFRFQTIDLVEKMQFEEVDGADCLLVKCSPSVESQFMESLWKDFAYLIWIDYQHSTIPKAHLTAASKSSPNTTLEITVGFSDFGKKMEIKAPMLSSTSN
ncbi:MAG: hypothetical protein ABRQ24_06895 [Syntrophomonadaceae bacterium]